MNEFPHNDSNIEFIMTQTMIIMTQTMISWCSDKIRNFDCTLTSHIEQYKKFQKIDFCQHFPGII